MAPRRPHATRWIDEQRLWVWMPYEGGSNRAWIKEHLAGTRPVWIEGEASTAGRWEVARTHLWKLVDALADRFGAVDVQLEFSNRSKCDTRCQGANPRTVFECECSCGGDNHGGAQGWKQWKPVGETTLIANERKLHSSTIQRGQMPAHLLRNNHTTSQPHRSTTCCGSRCGLRPAAVALPSSVSPGIEYPLRGGCSVD